MKGRLLTMGHLARRVAALKRRRPRPRVVLANGLFDLLHVGHVRYLRAASRLGDYLIVAINDDRSSRMLRGPGRPLVPARDRAHMVAALEGVDAVLIFGGRTVAHVLRRLRPDIHCKGTDYTSSTVPERDVVRSYGGRVRIAGDRKRHAATGMIHRIRERFGSGRAPRPACHP